MTKFETVAAVPGQQLEKRGKSIGVSLELRRELKQDRPHFAAQQRNAVLEQLQAVDGAIGQALPMRDELRRLPGEDEIAAGLLSPRFHRLRCRRPIEHAVELGSIELLGVVAKLLLQRQAPGKERTSPRGVMPARGANQNARHFPVPSLHAATTRPRSTKMNVRAENTLLSAWSRLGELSSQPALSWRLRPSRSRRPAGWRH